MVSVLLLLNCGLQDKLFYKPELRSKKFDFLANNAEMTISLRKSWLRLADQGLVGHDLEQNRIIRLNVCMREFVKMD